jgi:hypothetical protein
MRKNIFITLFLFLFYPAFAQAAQPGDLCSTAGLTQLAAGADQIPAVMLVCNGTSWRAIMETGTDGRSLTQVDNDTGDCESTKTGRLRYNEGTDTWEYCDGGGPGWLPFEQAAGGGGCSSGGLSMGGFCWYIGLLGQSCTTVCTGRGGYNTATSSYAGSSGTTANCQALKTAFVSDVGSWGGAIACPAGLGCVIGSGTGYRCTSPATTTGAAEGTGARFCACNS